jgi:polysaccharide export outer membrane protein/exopolysaccharide production protein ExoF
VRAAGSTTSDLAELIGSTLKSRIGLVEKPDVSIEVTQFRPFYIVGQVQKPGEYFYRPGMTVLQAMSVAGGLLRAADAAGSRLEREIISSKGELELLANELSALMARKARLDTELKRAEAIEYPQPLLDRQNEPFIRQAMEQERLIFESRKEGLETQLKALKQLKTFLEREVVSLSGQVGTHNTQLKLLKEELASVVTLSDKGLATAPRRLALERNVAQLEGEGMRMDSTLLRARQEISKTEIAILELDNKRSTEVTVELQQAQVNIERLSQKMETAERLLYESEVIAPRYFLDAGRPGRSRPLYTISRAVDGRVTEIPATESMIVEPGDTVKVDMPLGSGSSLGGAPLSLSGDGPGKLTAGPQRFSQDALRRSSN